MTFEETPLREALALIADRAGVDVLPDWHALEAAGGPGPDTPVNLKLKKPFPTEQVLRWSLRSAGGDAIGFAVDHGILYVGDRASLDRLVVTRAYDLEDLMSADIDAVIAIHENIAPASWRDAGGSVGGMQLVGTRLLVTQTEPAHRQVQKLLKLLREPHPKEKPAPAAAGKK